MRLPIRNESGMPLRGQKASRMHAGNAGGLLVSEPVLQRVRLSIRVKTRVSWLLFGEAGGCCYRVRFIGEAHQDDAAGRS